MKAQKFKKIIWEHYRTHRRKFPWRKTRDPYKICVSEIMLQQTQASRVIPRYLSFIQKFPTTRALANASLHSVLTEWQGLGYNRRGLYLKKCAEIIEKPIAEGGYGGTFPKDFKMLCTLPGIGPATAGDILAFAWNIPVPVIETNIRSVFIHFFFTEKKNVHDKEIIPLIENTLDRENTREWYWALFDYGAHLKETVNPSTRSKHYTKQSPFKGSLREKRSHILKEILKQPLTPKTLQKKLEYSEDSISKILIDLCKENLIEKIGQKFRIRK